MATALFIAVSTTGAFAQQITGSSSYSPTAGGARILAAQGDTAADPAIGFQSSVSDPTTAQNTFGVVGLLFFGSFFCRTKRNEQEKF